MGLLKAAFGAAGGVLADQWKDYFVADALPADVLVRKGQKKAGGRSSNTKGTDNIITSGSVIVVQEGQCMMIVDQGQIVEFAAEPGEYTYDASTEPTIFCGDLGEGIKQSFAALGKRFTFGGEPAKDQRVYFFNTKEIMGNKYGTPAPISITALIDRAVSRTLTIGIRCFGEYSFRLADPMLFYKNACGNVSGDYTRAEMESQMRTELLTALSPAFGQIAQKGIIYSDLTMHTMEMADTLNELLSKKWRDLRGIEIVSFGISSIRPDEESEAKIRQMQESLFYSDPTLAGARMAGAQANAMEAAASNTATGPAMAFMGMGMANQMGGMNAANLFQMGAQQAQQAQAAPASVQGGWQCACGATATGKFCPECGAKKPEPKAAGGWQCACGATATGKFCPECGAPKPADGWTCACGAVNKGKFCPECGAKKPAGVPQYKCDKCGWEPEKGTTPPKFCPECGDPFDSGDII
ncbi:MAG: SPFH domain-containing protein [Oscillospiraceae bacterium]|nr:SPFH domain-containing protein [Oscillospiraceae bacterium]